MTGSKLHLALFMTPLLLPCAAAPAASALDPAMAPVVQDDEVPDKRPVVKELVDKLKGHIKKRGKEDTEAIGTVDQLLQEFVQSGPKDRKDIAKVMGASLKVKRKPTDEGALDNRLHLAAAVALGEMAPESVAILESWIDHKQLEKDMAVQEKLILSLGKSKNDKAVDTLVDLLKHHQAIMQKAAAEALSNYAHLKQKERKDVFKKVLDQITSIKNAVESDPNDTISRERYDVVRASMIAALETLSGENIKNPSEWRSWWNNNKRKDWDKS